MAIEYTYTEAARRKYGSDHIAQTEANIKALVSSLPYPYAILLDDIGVNIEMRSLREKEESGVADYGRKKIGLNVGDFGNFTPTLEGGKPKSNFRYARATLIEETIHYIAAHINFDTSHEWIAAAKIDSQDPTKTAKELAKQEKKYNSSKKWERYSIYKIEKAMTYGERLLDKILSRSTFAAELLPTIILIRDCYADKNRHDDPSVVTEKMREAFPHSYDLVLRFEEQLMELAGRIEKFRKMDRSDGEPTTDGHSAEHAEAISHWQETIGDQSTASLWR